MQWTYDGTVNQALWITGGQWSGKSTVAGILAGRHGLTHYHCDFQGTRSHEDRRTAARLQRGEPPIDWREHWTGLTPEAMADQCLDLFEESFPWVLDDLRSLVSPHPVIADGWNLRPDLIAAAVPDVGRAIALVPTEAWRRHQIATLPRAAKVGADVPDPALAQRNRLERDRLLAEDVVERAHATGIRVIEIDGSRDAEAVADDVAAHFGLT